MNPLILQSQLTFQHDLVTDPVVIARVQLESIMQKVNLLPMPAHRREYELNRLKERIEKYLDAGSHIVTAHRDEKTVGFILYNQDNQSHADIQEFYTTRLEAPQQRIGKPLLKEFIDSKPEMTDLIIGYSADGAIKKHVVNGFVLFEQEKNKMFMPVPHIALWRNTPQGEYPLFNHKR